jgi:hypothetical protein
LNFGPYRNSKHNDKIQSDCNSGFAFYKTIIKVKTHSAGKDDKNTENLVGYVSTFF